MSKLAAIAWVIACVCACSDDAAGPITLTLEGAPVSAAGGSAVALELAAVRDSRPVAGLTVTLATTGGGTAPASLTTDRDGIASFTWALGRLPIENTLVIGEGTDDPIRARVDATTAGELAPTTFGDLGEFLTREAIAGSTEDLAFHGDELVLGVPGHLVLVGSDGKAAFLQTSGEALQRPLGLAYDGEGNLWIADGDADALLVMESGQDRKVRKVADRDGDERFVSPNDVATGPGGRVYMSDTCTGKVYAIDPVSGAIVARIAFDHATEGGPNGLVVGPPGSDDALWVTTENSGLFCGVSGAELTAPVAGLFRVPLTADGFGPRESIATGVAVFGDGLTFDREGNLYVLFDTVNGLALDETIVDVLPHGQRQLRRAFAAKGKVWANLVFGTSAFGETTLYLSLLQIAPFTETRGVERVEVGVR